MTDEPVEKKKRGRMMSKESCDWQDDGGGKARGYLEMWHVVREKTGREDGETTKNKNEEDKKERDKRRVYVCD